MAENTEKRIRTKRKMKDALIALCTEKAYYDITIGEICERASLYRSTFYRYYDTKDDVLREIEHDYIEDTRKLTPALREIHFDADEEEMKQYRKELQADLEYHKAHKDLCRFLLSPAGDIWFYNKMIESIGETVMNNLECNGESKGKKAEYQVNFIAAGFVSTIHRWLNRDDYSSSQLADFLISLMLGFH